MLFPTRCPGCGDLGPAPCARCRAELAPPPRVVPPEGVDGLVVLTSYEGVGRRLVTATKYRNHRDALGWMAGALAAELDRQAPDPAWDRGDEVVTWAPTVAAHRRRRGFDPAALLARRLARHRGRSAVALLRRLDHRPQTGLGGVERRRGPTFRAFRPVPPSVVLVDDVLTTGSTVAAAARALRDGGAHRILAAVVAETPPTRRTMRGQFRCQTS